MNARRDLPRRALTAARSALLAAAAAAAVTGHAATPLADQPLFTNTSVPGNLVLALSVEFPTAVSVAHQGAFVAGASYLGYFDPEKCYRYHAGTETGTDLSHFYPVSAATGRKCTALGDTWSGNFLNWLTMQAIDPFRWALTGGYRVVDTTDTTILERAWATSNSNNGGDDNFPAIPTSSSNPLKARPSPSATVIADHTPLTFSSLKVSVRRRGNQVWFTKSASLDNGTGGTPTAYTQSLTLADDRIYSFYARVKVCDAGAGYTREANCKAYPSGHYKPEGLLQQYAEKIRYSAFGYLNDPTDDMRDAGVLRARQKFIGPNETIPGSDPIDNPLKEWDPTTGVMRLNPDVPATYEVFGVPVTDSGVMNYLNKFGQFQRSYKRRDPVSELYYAALRYLKNQGNVPAWTNFSTDANKTRLIDGFPVFGIDESSDVHKWGDPVQVLGGRKLTCQRNFILGIGDTNTNWDRNLPGSTSDGTPAKPAQVSGDATVDARTATNKVGSLQGMGASLGTATISNGSYLMAGLAYDANTRDIRPDLDGRQSVQTYWLDVLEFGDYVSNNQFYLAAKYGGFKVPEDFSPYTHSTALPEAWWRTNTDTVGGQPRPDNYFTVARPDQMVDSLTKAFASIAAALRAYTTSFSTALPQVALTGNASFAAQFDSETWTGELAASELRFEAADGAPTAEPRWSAAAKLALQLAGTGWDLDRRVVTWSPVAGTGVPFRVGSIDPTQLATLDTDYRDGVDGADYLNYLRGDRLHEMASTAAGSSKKYRTRTGLLGDIVGSKARPVGPPSLPLSNASNPGYGAFKSAWSTRPTLVYVGANDGLLHAFNGALTGVGAGREVFAYVPSALFAGPNATPLVDGLAALGRPTFAHHYYVNASPVAFDIDFGRTVGGSGTDWRTVLIGGLGKGGKAYYAIDVTDPASMTSEAAVASKVLWEFTDPDMGHSYGEPTVVKTRQHGWVVVFASGYNNTDGQGYFFVVNPRTGGLIQKIATGSGTAGDPAGLAHTNAFVLDRRDLTADAVYAGDLQGKVWRLDVTAPTGAYPAPTQIAALTDALGNRQPVTTRPLVETDPKTGKRYILVGTGLMLDNSHVVSARQHSFYALIDGGAARFGTAADLPSGVVYPVIRGNLADNTNTLDDIAFSAASQAGWYIELGLGATGTTGWRLVNDPSSAFGLVTFTTTLPNADVCNPSGNSRVYALNFGTGRSVLVGPGGATIAYNDDFDGLVTDLRFFAVNGVPRLIAGTDTGKLRSVPGVFNSARGLSVTNWRRVPLGN